MEIKNAFSPRTRVAIVCDQTEHSAKQSFKGECDINNIMKKYRSTGILPLQSDVVYGEQNPYDLQTALNFVHEAQASFDSLPSNIRNRFKNDAVGFYNFVHDSNNFDECVKLGIFEKPSTAKPITSKTEPAVPSEN